MQVNDPPRYNFESDEEILQRIHRLIELKNQWPDTASRKHKSSLINQIDWLEAEMFRREHGR